MVSKKIWNPSKNYQNCLFEIKIGIQIDLNMLNSMVIFIFFVLEEKHSFWAKLGKKSKWYISDKTWSLE